MSSNISSFDTYLFLRQILIFSWFVTCLSVWKRTSFGNQTLKNQTIWKNEPDLDLPGTQSSSADNQPGKETLSSYRPSACQWWPLVLEVMLRPYSLIALCGAADETLGLIAHHLNSLESHHFWLVEEFCSSGNIALHLLPSAGGRNVFSKTRKDQIYTEEIFK